MDEDKFKQLITNYLRYCRPGDLEHSFRVVEWVKKLGEGRDDLDTLVIAAYIHDIGWHNVLPSGEKLTKAELNKYEPTANQNTEPMVRKVLDDYGNNSIDIDTVLRLIEAADKHKSSSEDEAVIVDADNLSKLNLDHVSEKYKKSDWLKMYELWASTFPERIRTEKGEELYPDLLTSLKSAIDKNTSLLDTYSHFISGLLAQLKGKEINTNELDIDHLGYQASSSDDYESKVEFVLNHASPLSESLVGGRRVGIFKLNESLKYEEQSFDIIEVVEPKSDQVVDSGWEHVEFRVQHSLEEFIEQYPEMSWDKSVIDRDEFPMLILKLDDGLRAKFPRLGVEAELERQKQ